MIILLTAYLLTAVALWIETLHRAAGLRRERYFGWRERTVLAMVAVAASLLSPPLAVVYAAGAARARLRAPRRASPPVRLRASHAS